ncbi:uncharacterized protein [Physcomitrium patens]|uniref:Uncharacterized protein n=1 Tax=Physcomitrium patens TaxID=3218 RepID=A0A2K1K3F3_PHYPA|nr:uncharacterized protein LOC112286224 [Physcomitrium patens]XP_024383682.1 uncharacterized protein LOC112286224 [Physcomitrium patens]XP_024383684.1 uncharacterized protein LOC112286224 [Physcomitrium patens]PNR48315.1 hypothetical protein PHYPA_012791 [Physcomitrium patens]|eukprot:XP_024383681.1 uncharacterized protein LOC112286224 [Physcomitrella patens]
MGKGRGFGGMRSTSMDGSYGRIKRGKDLCSISELRATEVPCSNFGYERVSKKSLDRRLSFSWSRKSSKNNFDTSRVGDAVIESQSAASSCTVATESGSNQEPRRKSLFGIRNFMVGILDSYKKIMQSAEDSNVRFSDLYPRNAMMAPVTPATRSSSIKYVSPSPGVGRHSFVTVEEAFRER